MIPPEEFLNLTASNLTFKIGVKQEPHETND